MANWAHAWRTARACQTDRRFAIFKSLTLAGVSRKAPGVTHCWHTNCYAGASSCCGNCSQQQTSASLLARLLLRRQHTAGRSPTQALAAAGLSPAASLSAGHAALTAAAQAAAQPSINTAAALQSALSTQPPQRLWELADAATAAGDAVVAAGSAAVQQDWLTPVADGLEVSSVRFLLEKGTAERTTR